MNNHAFSLENLNKMQREAVTTDVPHNLVLAGAGSGKTRVLVYRIWWLIKNHISPFNILAVTFTNKAANEMRHRLEEMLGINLKHCWIGTFHGLAHRMLRLHFQEANLPQTFQVIDSEDQLAILRKIHKALKLDEEQWSARQSQNFINGQKERARRARHVNITHPQIKTLVEIYQEYEAICTRSGLVDFAELLLSAYELLNSNAKLRDHYRMHFQHLLIDEFQDTNSIQYLWIKLLSGTNTHILAVGDDDQSIYSWRGATVENMQHLRHDFPNTKVIRLEQNYRSTANILGAANSVIANNQNRMGKKLWTEDHDGDLITVYTALNEIDEADYIVRQIRSKNTAGSALQDMAILYRSNAQSRVLEEQLLQAQIPYRIYGGLRFFERAEIKDLLAYLRLITNPKDDAALERIINVPTRGIGNTSLLALRSFAQNNNLCLWDAIAELNASQKLPPRATKSIQGFIELITDIKLKIDALPFHELISYAIEKSDLKSHYLKIKNERAQIKLENLDELINSAKRFALINADETNLNLLNLFLNNATLESGETENTSDTDNCVQLMTLHSAKGLEFPVVFLCGMEEGLFPHQMSMNSPTELEEERRLCYVGMTRAMQKLYLVHASTRYFYGTRTMRMPSRFLSEIPTEFTELEEMQLSVEPTMQFRYSSNNANFRQGNNQNSSNANFSTIKQNISTDQNLEFNIGQQVKHQVFGEGTIVDFAGQGEYLRLYIRFKRVGSKWLSPLYAKLETE